MVGDIMNIERKRIIAARKSAHDKALDSLGRYKFEMFGYWASSWVKYNALLSTVDRQGNPFIKLVKLARELNK